MKNMTYEEAAKEILSAPRFKKVPSVVNMKQYLVYLGHPEQDITFIHVAGTNGKGSTCSFLESILRKKGIKTGLFTSPHLITMRERMQINRELVPEDIFVESYQKILQAQEESGYPPLTFFELVFAMAVLAFQKMGVEYAVIETGMGGRLDATNAVTPVLSIITAVGMDHMQYLGDTIEKIAWEKAGIMKPGVPCLFVDHHEGVTEVFHREAKKNMTPLCQLSEDSFKLQKIAGKVIDFSVENRYYINSRLAVRSKGTYQVENGAVAATAAKILFPEIEDSIIKEGLLEAYWPGRMEEVEEGVILDGAHNEPSIKAFLQSVKKDNVIGDRILVFAVAADKDYDAMARDLMRENLFEQVILTRIPYERMEDPVSVKPIFQQYTDKKIDTEESMERAYHRAVSMKKEKDLIYMVGSLYFVGAMKEFLDLDKERK